MSRAGVSPWVAGVLGRCPKCGEGPLYGGFLRLADRCEACGLELKPLNVADGPAFFAMSIVGVLTGFAALFVEVAVRPAIWVHLIVWLPLAVILSMLLLRPIKGILVAFQYRHRAAEVRNEDF